MLDINKILAESDGSGRELRPVQVQAITEIVTRWNPNRHFVLSAPVASGKSLILRTIQKVFNGNIVTPTNQLVQQYEQSYPDLNKLIGGTHYKCGEYLTNCAVGQARYNCKGGVDSQCCLAQSREAFLDNKPTILNTMSAFVNRTRFGINGGNNYIDEAHQLCSNVRSLTTTTIKFGPTERAILRKMGVEKQALKSELKMCEFLERKIEKYTQLMNKSKDEDDQNKYYAVIENTSLTHQALSANPEVFVIEWDDGHLRVLPVFAPRKVIDKVLGRSGVLASGTFMPHDLTELLGPGEYERFDCDSPIPADRRRVIADPVDCGFSYETIRPDLIAKRIWEIYNSRKKQPLFVHATYSMAEKLRFYLTSSDVLFHDKNSKIDVVDQFKNSGGLMIGSGLTEGLDLAGDVCKAQIIIQLQFPNLGDMYVQKRKALSADWYSAETCKTFLQSIGRTTRFPTDFSETFVLDSRFKNTYNNWVKSGLIPKYVQESVVLK